MTPHIFLSILGSFIYDMMYGDSICGGWLSLVSMHVSCGCVIVCLVFALSCCMMIYLFLLLILLVFGGGGG